MISHTCGTQLPADVGALVEHLAECTNTDRGLALICRRLVQTVSEAVAVETPTVSPTVSRDTTETPTETRDLTPAEMHAMHRDGETGGKSLRDIAAVSGVAPETVRRRIAKHKKEAGL